jgi:hypothetical protein
MQDPRWDDNDWYASERYATDRYATARQATRGPAGPGQPTGPGRPAGEQRDPRGQHGTRRAGPARRWGRLPGRTGVLMVVASTILGLIVTALAGQEPGLILAVFLIGGTTTAVFAVRRAAVHLIIPVPALACAVAATFAGLAHDPSALSSRTALAIDALQWIAGVFAGIGVATFIAIAVTVLRKPKRRRARNRRDDLLRQAW